MRQLHVSSRAEWRSWLAENHAREKNGILLVYFRVIKSILSAGL